MRGKTGIITLGGRFNYGNRLQNYATSVVWSSLGFEPTSLYLDDRFNLVKSTKAFIRKLIKKESLDPEASMEECRLAAFDRFNKLIPSRNLPSLKKGLSNE